MRSSTVLAATDDAVVYAVTCAGDHAAGRRRSRRGRTAWCWCARDCSGYAITAGRRWPKPPPPTCRIPDRELQFAHPRGGDVCTSVTVSNDFWQTNFASAAAGDAHSVPVDARVETAHLMLLRATTCGRPPLRRHRTVAGPDRRCGARRDPLPMSRRRVHATRRGRTGSRAGRRSRGERRWSVSPANWASRRTTSAGCSPPTWAPA